MVIIKMDADDNGWTRMEDIKRSSRSTKSTKKKKIFCLNLP